jgi:type 1 glutamine amidotransferase
MILRIATTLAATILLGSAADPKPLPPDSTEAMGQSFAEPRPAGHLRVLLVGAGSSHDFPKYFLGADAATLRAAGNLDVAATPNLAEALALLPQADVLVFSGNHPQFAAGRFQKALNDHADAGKGIVLLHAATWIHPWPDYNQRFVQGGSTGHGYGEVKVKLLKPAHPVVAGLPAEFTITDESYHHQFGPAPQVEILAENGPDDKSKKPHASVWIVKDPKARIVCITLGHAAEAHSLPSYQQLITQAVRWAGK